MNGEILWRPPADVLERSRIGDYLRWLREERNLDFIVPAPDGGADPAAAYHALWQWSVTDVAAFWRSIWDYFDVVAYN
ncbi:MAG TPA: hypothetical protein VHN18_20180, partial [Micromonosporaceae bacterium]|nr:hypothetical protein [Micromonosporaceae bacterium]